MTRGQTTNSAVRAMNVLHFLLVPVMLLVCEALAAGFPTTCPPKAGVDETIAQTNPTTRAVAAARPVAATLAQAEKPPAAPVGQPNLPRVLKGGIVLVERGQAKAAVVTAGTPSRMAAYAAQELVAHVKKATGVELPVVKESAAPADGVARVYVGVTQAAARLGIKSEAMKPDAYVLRTAGGDLYVAGKEAANTDPIYGIDPDSIGWYREPLCKLPYSGTLFGVYDLLERALGARWIWPGDLGTYVPRTDTVAVAPLDLTVAPKLVLRYFAYGFRPNWIAFKPRPESFSSEAEWKAFTDSQMIFERRQRQGVSEAMPMAHHQFTWWYKQFGKDHPGWFMMDEGGNRGNTQGAYGPGQPMCVSNPELARFIVENDWDALWNRDIPDRSSALAYRRVWLQEFLDLSESDDIRFCHCSECMALDVSAPEGYDLSNVWTRRVISDRYAAFWKRVYDLAVQRNRNVTIHTYLYWQTFPAPLGDVKLNRNFVGEFVPWMGQNMWMPMPEKVLQNVREHWLGWQKTGMTMIYRPNYMHAPGILPFFSIDQAGEFFRFTARNGSIGAYYDSLFGHYGVQALSLYVHMRLMWDPGLEIPAIRREFNSAFGPAADAVDRYFRYWEDYSQKIVDQENWPAWSARLFWRATQLYSPEVLDRGDAILREALAAAQTSPEPEFAERVRFLQAGLEHTRLFLRLMGTLEMSPDFKRFGPCLTDRAKFEASQQAYRELLAFRKAHERTPLVDLSASSAGFQENREFTRDMGLLEKDFDTVKQAPPKETSNAWAPWLFRKDAGDVGVAEGWFKPEAGAKDWTAIKVPGFWDAAIGPYTGYGWYRTTFKLPADWKGRQVNLDFGAVDEQAWVYLNGVLAGEHTTQSTGLDVNQLRDKTFTVEVKPERLRYGAENTLVVRVHNSAAAGGIHKPVVGYAPHPEKWFPLPAR